MLDKFHAPRPQWYEELQAMELNKGMEAYEAEVSLPFWITELSFKKDSRLEFLHNYLRAFCYLARLQGTSPGYSANWREKSRKFWKSV